MDGIYLDDFKLSDAAALHRIARDPAFFYAYLNENRMPAWRGVLRFLWLVCWTRLRRPRHWLKAVRRPGKGMIGCVVILDLHVRAPGLAEIAYFIAAGEQGRGVGKFAVISALRWAWDNHGLRRLYAQVDPGNAPSKAVLRRLNMEFVRHVPVSRSGAFDRAGNPRPREVWGVEEAALAAALAQNPPGFPVA